MIEVDNYLWASLHLFPK